MGNERGRRLRKTARKSRRNQKGGQDPCFVGCWDAYQYGGPDSGDNCKEGCCAEKDMQYDKLNDICEAKTKEETEEEIGGKRRRRRRGRKTARKSRRKGRKSARKSRRRSRR